MQYYRQKMKFLKWIIMCSSPVSNVCLRLYELGRSPSVSALTGSEAGLDPHRPDNDTQVEPKAQTIFKLDDARCFITGLLLQGVLSYQLTIVSRPGERLTGCISDIQMAS